MYNQVVESCDCEEKRLSVVMLEFRGRSGYSRCWVLPVMRVNSLRSASSQILAKVVERLAC